MTFVNEWHNYVPAEGWRHASHLMEKALLPETPLEHQLLQNTDFVRGLLWGVPRYGHPEGEVFKHIQEVLRNIDQLPVDQDRRSQLRTIAFAHDTFKYLEDKSHPRDWTKHHGPLARRFMEAFSSDPLILDIIELHDEAYYAWRLEFLLHKPEEGFAKMNTLWERLGNDKQMYYLFFKCDTLTGDKNPAPLKWFEKTIEDIKIIHF